MTGFQIREQIDKNNAKINQSFRPEVFVLDTKVAELIQENRLLRKQCEHKFENGICVYCDCEEGSI